MVRTRTPGRPTRQPRSYHIISSRDALAASSESPPGVEAPTLAPPHRTAVQAKSMAYGNRRTTTATAAPAKTISGGCAISRTFE